MTLRAAVPLLLLLPGCATIGQRESTVTLPSGEVYAVRCQADGALKYRQGDMVIEVDNRGRASVLEQILGTLALGFARTPEVITK